GCLGERRLDHLQPLDGGRREQQRRRLEPHPPRVSSVDAIEEFKIQRNNYGAEFGQAGGAQVNLVTRGGTNEFHGSSYYFARRDKWNSTDFFLKEAHQEKAPLKWDDFGGTFGGPIIKDKLHFFVSMEWNKDKRSDVRT